MMEIEIPAESMRFPGKCACCLKPTRETRGLKKHKFSFWAVLVLQRTLEVKVPYCASCQRHVVWAKGGRMLGVVLSGIVNAVLLLLLGGLVFTILRLASPSIDENPDVPRLAVLGLALVIAGLLTWRRLKSRPAQPLGATHTRESEAVQLSSFTKRSVRLQIHNDRFARELLDMNSQASVA
jgi:hypothetical protein